MDVITIQCDDHLCELIERFGKKLVKSMCAAGLIIYGASDEYLLEYGFKKKILSIVRGHINRGKLPMHINKTSGKVKKCFQGYTLASNVDELEAEQSPKNKAILKRLCDRFYEAYVVRYKKQFEGIDLETDPITCEAIVYPAYIKTDWDNNCKIVYSLNTILQFYEKKMDYLGYFFSDESGEDVYPYKESRLDHYISPYTKKKFYESDIIFVNENLLKN